VLVHSVVFSASRDKQQSQLGKNSMSPEQIYDTVIAQWEGRVSCRQPFETVAISTPPVFPLSGSRILFATSRKCAKSLPELAL